MSDIDVREPKYVFIRDENNFPAGCVAYSYNRIEGKITFGFSIHHPKDKFDRSLARHIAKQRMMKRPEFSWCAPNTPVNKILYNVCCDLQQSDLPGRFKQVLSNMKRRLLSSK